jgi:SagB-type dehydrogenase family enzyme
MTPEERAISYHNRTKHNLNRYARALGYMDWATQPDPFRTYKGAPQLLLPLLADKLTSTYQDLYRPSAIPAAPVDLAGIATLFELALGLSAWKQAGKSRWALRCNPSSGNLHPTEGYLLTPGAPGVPPGLYHYVSRDHLLERRSTFNNDAAQSLAALLPPGAIVIGLSSIHWREAWKYGERAFRYCQHDAGHAIASTRYAAAALGWSAVMLNDLGDDDLSAILGLDRADDFTAAPADREHPDTALLILPGAQGEAQDSSPAAQRFCESAPEAVRIVRGGQWAGQANALSSSHVDWPIIDDVAEATHKPPTQESPFDPPGSLPPHSSANPAPLAAEIIRRRRSAVSFDGHTSIDSSTFYSMLDRLLPRPGVPPWDAVPWPPHIHAVLFVHRVRGLDPGLYVFERSAAVHDRLRAALDHDWERPPACPEHLRLYCLAKSDLRDASQIVSCHQEIASDGAFSLGMIADFSASLRARGASFYRRLFWEAGILGHALYLEAETPNNAGDRIRATGIGCYFDDVFHQLCGITTAEFQSLYHFTVGGPVDDARLTTHPPYDHLAPDRIPSDSTQPH